MPSASVPADVTSVFNDEALGFSVLTKALDVASENVEQARLIADALDVRLLHTSDTDAAAVIALNIAGADAQLARARQFVADLQARRAQVAQDCAAAQAMLDFK